MYLIPALIISMDVFVDENDNLVYSYYYDLKRCGVVLGDFISPLQQVDVDCFKADVYR